MDYHLAAAIACSLHPLTSVCPSVKLFELGSVGCQEQVVHGPFLGWAGWAIFALCFSGLRPLFLLTLMVVGVQGGSALSSTSSNIGCRAEAHAPPGEQASPALVDWR